MKARKPDCLVIGAMKSGTTSLHYYLSQHPDIHMSEPKELDYFTFNYSKGEEWYRSHFVTNKKLCGESSQNYTKRHDQRFSMASERIARDLPEAKLIYIVRHPVSRIISHIHENIAAHEYQADFDFDGFIQENPENHWVWCSRYYYQLEVYAKQFAEGRLLVITLEELQQDINCAMYKVFNFLDIEPISYSDSISSKNSFNTKYYLSTFSKFFARRPALRASIKRILSPAAERIKQTSVYKDKILKRKVAAVRLNDNTLSTLNEVLQEDLNLFCGKYLNAQNYPFVE